ncbi:phage minor capsid protein [Convivina intestini]|uniref:Minor capsid protein 2 n=1 Tax=Convivina intestini TaxID=1505726 RepID=A0A2U1DFQ9_9LACO|nr:phage minor capsid protein [Convivina intestini]PVY86517.1 minor capsid protein 2 [Convivina intestini]CAH1857481.1 hypothetical protein R077811_01527 [Convivina intestini]SDC13276.1 Phage minor capsid protein 2 [Leuconostocaceae bacterium R-53105]
MITHDSLNNDANRIVDEFSLLEQMIFKTIINRLQDIDISNYDADNILDWQVRQLSNAGMLNSEVIKLVAKQAGKSINEVSKVLTNNGIKIVDDVDGQLSKITGDETPMSEDAKNIIHSVARQAHDDLSNVVNQSLLTRNDSQNAAVKVYQDIVTKSTLAVTTGIKTPERALFDNIYQWVAKGLPTNLVDSSGRRWSLETYSRLVIGNTAHQTFNDLRLKRMNDYGVGQALMSSHHASREACAYIQGHVVNIVPVGSPNYDDSFDSIYNHGYGTPAGTQGANCHHTLTPFDPEANTVPDSGDIPNPDKALANAQVQAKQRQIERAIRASKKKLAVAQELDDTDMITRIKSQIANQQANIRKLIDENSWLGRDYSREKVVTI